MTLPNASATIAGGDVIATHLISAKEYQVIIPADDSGHLSQSVPSYTFFIKSSALNTAAIKIHWDIFNAVGSGKLLELRGLWIMPALNAAVTGTISPDWDLFRTNAVGTGGTTLAVAATFPSFAQMDTVNTPALPAQVTMRAAPTGGATTLHALLTSFVMQEETNAGGQMEQWFNILPMTSVGQRYAANEGQGFKLVQNFPTGIVAQNCAIFGMFTLVP